MTDHYKEAEQCRAAAGMVFKKAVVEVMKRRNNEMIRRAVEGCDEKTAKNACASSGGRIDD